MGVVAEEVVVDLIARQDKLSRVLMNAERETSRRLDRIEGLGRSFATKFSAALGGVSAIALAKGLLTIADAAKNLDAQLRLATAQTGNFSQATDDVRRIAEVTRSGLTATAGLYGNFVRNARELGIGQAEAARATETFSKTLKISGASAVDAAQGTRQFVQGLQSGVLRGDEFNSIMENSPRLARLLGDSLGVPIGALRAMAEEGELTSDKLVRALTDQKFTAGIDAEFQSLPVTFEQAMEQVHNAAIITFGAFDRGGEFSTALANFFSDSSEGFGNMETAAESAGISIRSTFESLVGVFFPLQDHALTVFDVIRSEAVGLRNAIADILGAADSVRNSFNRAAQGARNGVLEGATEVLTGGPIGRLNPGYRQWVRDKLGGSAPPATPVGPKENWRDQFLRNAAKGDAERGTRAAVRSFREQGIFGGGLIPVEPDAPASPRARSSGGGGKKKAKGGRKGPSAETLARRAESLALAEERRAQSFANEEANLQRDLAAARSALANSAEVRAQAERDMIEKDRVEYAAEVASKVRQKKLRDEGENSEARRLLALNDQVAAERTKVIDLEEAARKRRLAAEAEDFAVDAAEAANRDQQDLLQSRAELADTTRERRDIELRLVDLQFEEERIRLRAIIAESERLNAIENATESEKDAARSAAAAADIARKRLGILPELQANARDGVSRANESPMAAYRRGLSREAKDIGSAIEQIEVDRINQLEDAFAGAAAKALGLRGIVGDLISDLARLAFRQMVLAALPGGGGIAGGIGKLFGLAGGGSVFVGGNAGTDRNVMSINGQPVARVNKGERIDVVPQGRAIRPVGGQVTRQVPPVVKNFNISVSADHSVTPAGFAQDLAGKILQKAQQMDAAMGAQVMKTVPGRMARYQTDGR